MSEGFALEANGLSKRFDRFEALRNIDIAIPAGSVCGLVGPNGAGKSTTFALACGFLAPTSGAMRVLGHDARDKAALAGRVGAMPQDAALPSGVRIGNLLTDWAELGGLVRREARREAATWLERVGLGAQADVRAGALSHGMRVRASLAQAFLGAPDLVLLDEPTAGLDPRSAEGVRSIIRAEAGRRTIVISSHDLAELETLCDQVVILDRGTVVRQGTLAEVTARGGVVRITLAEVPTPAVVAALREQAGVTSLVVDGDTLRVELGPVDPDNAVSLVLAAVIGAGGRIIEVARGTRLEERFLALTEQQR